MSTVILNGDQIYTEELIRENARLTVQLEAERMKLAEANQSVEELMARIDGLEAAAYAQEAMEDYREVKAKLNKAILDIRFLMTGGDPCEVCAKTCKMGQGCFAPVWKGVDGQ